MGWGRTTEPRVPEVCAGPMGWETGSSESLSLCPEHRRREEGEGGRVTEGMLGIHFLFHK